MSCVLIVIGLVDGLIFIWNIYVLLELTFFVVVIVVGWVPGWSPSRWTVLSSVVTVRWPWNITDRVVAHLPGWWSASALFLCCAMILCVSTLLLKSSSSSSIPGPFYLADPHGTMHTSQTDDLLGDEHAICLSTLSVLCHAPRCLDGSS